MIGAEGVKMHTKITRRDARDREGDGSSDSSDAVVVAQRERRRRRRGPRRNLGEAPARAAQIGHGLLDPDCLVEVIYLAQGSQAQRRDAIAARARPSVPDQTSPMSDLLSGSANGAAVAT